MTMAMMEMMTEIPEMMTRIKMMTAISEMMTIKKMLTVISAKTTTTMTKKMMTRMIRTLLKILESSYCNSSTQLFAFFP